MSHVQGYGLVPEAQSFHRFIKHMLSSDSTRNCEGHKATVCLPPSLWRMAQDYVRGLVLTVGMLQLAITEQGAFTEELCFDCYGKQVSYFLFYCYDKSTLTKTTYRKTLEGAYGSRGTRVHQHQGREPGRRQAWLQEHG